MQKGFFINHNPQEERVEYNFPLFGWKELQHGYYYKKFQITVWIWFSVFEFANTSEQNLGINSV